MNYTHQTGFAAAADDQGSQSVYIRSLGAAQTVTGSKHLLVTPELNVLIDCGLFQGIKSLREKNWEPLSVQPSHIDALILTHAHLDHCGYIPLLVKNGYKGKIYMSEPTRDLTELILRDSAKLQEEDAEKANRGRYSKHNPAKPLYDTAHVEAALSYFEVIDVLKPFRLSKNIEFEFYPGAHILGTCSVKVSCYDKVIVFSGDIGRYHSELLPAPTHAAKADFVIMESTYGDRLHEKGDPAEEVAIVVNDALWEKGNILIPCFAVGRAQEVMHILYRLKKSGKIPATIPVYLDSPMGASAGRILQKYPGWLSIDEKECAQMFSGITINQDYRGTEQIIRRKGSKIILAASGMMTGGRVLEYLKHYITDARNTLLVIGYQAEGTRGRALLNGAYEIKIHGKYYQAKAKVTEIGGLSAHADQGELIAWLKTFEAPPAQVYLVHGEPSAQDALRIKIKDELGLPVGILKQDDSTFLFSINNTVTNATA